MSESVVIWVAPTVVPGFNAKLAYIHGIVVTVAGVLGIVINIVKYAAMLIVAAGDARVGWLLSTTAIGLATIPAVMSVMVS